MIIIGMTLSLIFFALALLMLKLFFDFKKRKDEFNIEAKNYSPWSFKGYYLRNKYQIPLFMVFLFSLLSLAFLIIII